MDGNTSVAGGQYASGGVKKVFSLPQAERALVLVKTIASDAAAVYAHLLQTQRMLEKIQRCGPVEQIQSLQGEMGEAVDRLEGHIDELTDVGVELRDLDRGEVDFPALLGGRIVCLCWRLGEERVSHWHETNAEFMQRRPVEELVGAARPAVAGTGRG